MKSFSYIDRQKNISYLKQHQDEVFDVLIIGGGITGAGVARDAASRGLKVLLVEANDFAFGTSSRSSKLIHGGLRYLENFEFGLVYEALNERELLFELAPHLIHPLRFLLPIYKKGRVGFFMMGCAMWLYDTLSLFQSELHERLDKEESIYRAPSLNEEGLLGSYVYSDAYMDDDRLTIETLRSANNFGATCLNYVKFVEGGFDKEVKKIILSDELSNEKISVKAKHCVCTVGPWTDVVGKQLTPDWKNILQPSKGIHLTLPFNKLPLKQAVVMADDSNKRIVFGIPRHDMVIVGTTDNSYKGDPAKVRATTEDVAYLIGVLKEYFPEAKLTKDDFLASYAGVRPLVKEQDAGNDVGKTSREHTILSNEKGITFVAGGKYTTYRRMAEEITDKVLESFSLEFKAGLQSCKTREPLNSDCTNEKIEKSKSLVEQWSKDYNLHKDYVEKLVFRHGMESAKILAENFNKIKNEDNEILYWSLEAKQAIKNTMCINLVDFYWRRTPLFLSRKDHGQNLINNLADIFAAELGWTESEKTRQIDTVKKQMDFELSWR